MNPNILTQIALTLFPFTIAYIYWLAYRYPTKNRLTRFIYSYVEATRFPPFSATATVLAVVIISLAVGIASLVATIVSIVDR